MEKVLITKGQIDHRNIELAKEIDSFYDGKEILLIGVLNGSIIFLADLIRHIKSPLHLDCLSVSSYRNDTTSGELVFHPHLKTNVENSHILLVDDIFDTGKTLNEVGKFFKTLNPASIEFCVFLKKNVPKKFEIKPRFVGFEIDNHFVFGYGLDIAEKYRNLPYVAYRS